MTVIDRAHRFVLILMVTTIPTIFLVDLIAEVIRGEITVSPGWQIYLVIVGIAAYQIRTRRWDADWIIVGGGVGTAALGLVSYFGTVTVIDFTASVVILPMVGLVAIAVSRHVPVITGAILGTTAVALPTIAFVNEGLSVDDIITKSAAVAILFGLGGVLLYELRMGYEDQYAARDRFVAAVSHELRTPLTALAGFSELLADDPGNPEIVAEISAQAREAANIVEDLLVAARSDSGQVTVTPEPTDIKSEAEAVISAMLSGHLAHGKTIVSAVEPTLVEADPLRLRQIVRNLITNAIRHGGNHIEVRSQTEDGFGCIEVADDGDGFGSDETEKLFAPYGRSRTTDLASGSIGLGLTVSRQLARLMRGDLAAFRRNDITVFRLSLPLADHPTEQSEARSPSAMSEM